MLSVFMRTAIIVPKNERKMEKIFVNTESVATFATLTDGNCTYLAGQAVNLLILYMGIFYARTLGYWRLPIRRYWDALRGMLPSVSSVYGSRFLVAYNISLNANRDMENLITNQKGMTSIEISEVTGKQHAHVMRDIRNLLSQGVAESNFGLGSYTDANAQERPLFNLTPKGCLILASGYDAVLRERIIDRLEVLESEKKNGSYQVPKTFSEALMLAAMQAEQLENVQKQIEQKDKSIAKLQPKAKFADAAFKAENSKVDIGQAAKILNLGFGRNTLFKKLKELGVFFANRNEPKQKYVDAGYFEMTEKFIERNEHPGFVVTKVICTQKGLAYINTLFGGKKSDGKLAKIV